MEYHLSIRGREHEGPLDLESFPSVWTILSSPPSRELLSTCSSKASHQPHHHHLVRSSLVHTSILLTEYQDKFAVNRPNHEALN